MGFLWYIIIGIAAGFLAGKIMRGGGFGVIINLILGIVGSVLGGWVFGLLGIAASGIIGSLITATVGAILMLWIASLFNKRNADQYNRKYRVMQIRSIGKICVTLFSLAIYDCKEGSVLLPYIQENNIRPGLF